MEIYYAFLSDYTEEELSNLFFLLPKEKQEQLEKVKNQKSKNESILSWYLLRKALSKKSINDFSVAFSERGKPYLLDIPYFFNISHSGDFVFCAVSENEVGIDVQKIQPVSKSLVNKVLCENERKTICGCDDGFIWYWAVKESFVKFSQKGITEEMFSLDFSKFFKKCDFTYETLFFTVEKYGKYYVSVCSRDKERRFIKV